LYWERGSSVCSALLEIILELNPRELVSIRFACAAISHAESPVSANRAILDHSKVCIINGLWRYCKIR
jgi:hypothetical protein